MKLKKTHLYSLLLFALLLLMPAPNTNAAVKLSTCLLYTSYRDGYFVLPVL